MWLLTDTTQLLYSATEPDAGRVSNTHTQSAFLPLLFRLLDIHTVRYCVLHSWADLPHRLSSDLDIAVHPHDRNGLVAVIGDLRAAGFPPIQIFDYSPGAHYFVFAWNATEKPGFACVDVLFEHWRSGLQAATLGQITASRQRERGFWVSAPHIEFSYLLAKRTWKGVISAPQTRRIKELAHSLGPQRAKEIIGETFLEPWRGRVLAGCMEGNLACVLSEVRRIPWLTSAVSQPLNLARFLARDAFRRVQRWVNPTGLLVAVLGTDGTGKSTPIGHLQSQLAPAFRRVKRLHWAPRVVIPLRDAAKHTNPHSKPIRGRLLSSCFLMAVVIDYWLGFLFSLGRCRARSHLILFDRYFHDVLVDPRRYRYGGPRWLAFSMARFIPRPDLVLILDANERVIAGRKAELPLHEILRQRRAYMDLQFPSAVKIAVNTETDEDATQSYVSGAIVGHLARRFEIHHPEWLPRTEPSA